MTKTTSESHQTDWLEITLTPEERERLMRGESETPEEIKEPKDPIQRLTYEDFDYEKLNVYAGLDCIATSELVSRLYPEVVKREEIAVFDGSNKKIVTAPEILKSYTELEMPAHEFILDLEINGMKYSIDRNRFFDEKMKVKVGELDDIIFRQLGKRIDLNSGTVVAEFLYKEKGLKIPSFTKGGEPATDGEALLTLAGLDPLAGKYVAPNSELQYLADMALRKDISATHNTFVRTYVKDFVKRDGRIHPSYNQFGTSSFRITGSDPNLTQLPRPKHGYNIRTCYTVEPGYAFISFDFSSAEVKVLANISKDPTMMKFVELNYDFHSASASSMYGIPYEEFVSVLSDQKHPLYKTYKNYRQIAKVLTFSLLYGSSPAGIANQLYMEKSKAEELMSIYFKTFPGVSKYINNAHKFASYNQFSLTPLGQRKRQYGTFPCFRGTAAYNASLRNSQNVIIQSTTSTLGLATFTELNRLIKPLGARSTCTVYDSIEIECPIERVAEVVNLAYHVLNTYPQEQFDFMELPIGCEGDIGISWGETRVVHEGLKQEEVNGILGELKQESIASFGKWID